MMCKNKKEDRDWVFSAQERDNIRWFWKNYLREKSMWLVLLLSMVGVQGVIYQQFLSLTESGLRVIFDSSDLTQLYRLCGIVFLLFAVRAVISFLVPRISSWVANDAVLSLRKDLVKHLLILDLEYFDKRRVGDTILRLVNQADDMGLFVGMASANAVRDTITVVIVGGYLIYKSAFLFMAAAIFIPVVLLAMGFISLRIKRIQANAESAVGDYINTIEEACNGIRTVKVSGQEDREQQRLFSSARGIKGLSIRLQSAQAVVQPVMDMVAAFAYMLVIGGGGYMVIIGGYGLDSAGLITFLLGLTLLFDPARRVANFYTMLQANLVILDSIRSILLEKPTICDKDGAGEEFDNCGNIELKDVCFGYERDDLLFDKLNLTIMGGKNTAIVGSTGSGKTTIISLITRLYDIIDGSIKIGSTDIGGIRIKALRKSFSVVSQDIVVFNASLMENIRYVRPDATDEAVWAAADSAEISDLMRSRGDAPLGPKGSQLSGGQKQRIAIARAILQDAPILLLDEATSALDQRTEEKVQAALNKASRGRTTVTIAHRLSTVTHADWIYVLEHGKVVEEGTHSDLIAKNGLYSAMYKSQKTGYE